MNTKIIVDACRNHYGCDEIIEKMILVASISGADYIKFQVYNSARLNLRHYKLSERVEYHRHQLSDVQIQKILNTCKFAKIAPMFTIFTDDRINFLGDLFSKEVVSIKIASPDMMNANLLEKIQIKFWDKEIFMSTGMHTIAEIEKMKKENDDINFLYCISKYPTLPEEVNYQYMSTFDGFSDHTKGIECAKKAIDLGIGYIEKHFTLSHNLPGKDVKVSIEPEELRELCTYRNSISDIKKYKERWKW